MAVSRVTPKRLPVSPGRDSRFSIRRNMDQGGVWWVYYEPPGADLLAADQPHSQLVDRVNELKVSQGSEPGGAFSLNEHGQVIARLGAPAGYNQNAIHVIDVAGGTVFSYSETITFAAGTLRPDASVDPGSAWPGPLCGITYRFSAPNARRPPSNNLDEIRIEVNGQQVQISQDAAIRPYPPAAGPLADFRAALRAQLPLGGRFRVNEKGRAFTSVGNRYIGVIPGLPNWFRPISPLD